MSRIPIALQLYSVRHECEKDLVSTVKAVAEMGYEGVEFAGYYGRTAEELKDILDEFGLKVAGTHIGLTTLLGDEFDKTVAFNKTIGNKYLVVPGLPGKYTSTIAGWIEVAGIMGDIANKLKPLGMLTGYHNHAIEFKPLEGKIPWDVFFENTDESVIAQYDIGNSMHGGADPIAVLEKYAARGTTIHVKEFSASNPKAIIGEGDVPWAKVFEIIESAGKTDWYIVEYESDAYPPLKSVELCLKNLKKMGK